MCLWLGSWASGWVVEPGGSTLYRLLLGGPRALVASLRWRISTTAVHAARDGVAPAGAKGWLRVSMCQIASADVESGLSSMKGWVVSRGGWPFLRSVAGCLGLAGNVLGSMGGCRGFRGCDPGVDRRVAGRCLAGQAPCACMGGRRRWWRLTRRAESGSGWGSCCAHRALVVGCRRMDCGPAGGGSAPVIHPVALGGPECRAVLRGSIKWSAVGVLARP